MADILKFVYDIILFFLAKATVGNLNESPTVGEEKKLNL
jgi:hypothetical protein